MVEKLYQIKDKNWEFNFQSRMRTSREFNYFLLIYMPFMDSYLNLYEAFDLEQQKSFLRLFN